MGRLENKVTFITGALGVAASCAGLTDLVQPEARREPATRRPWTRFLHALCGTLIRYVA